ncbi:MAG: MgtC/SapB family protein [Phycisphaerales bacterium]|jgi:putative Mg2+ transporter-C (MgtC) family protein|nr:MgtC/SapB family protein [Phycisphaerales bacterium]
MILANFLDSPLTHWYVDATCRLLAAAVLGALIGIEREIHGRDAGFRTQLLVALGSALAMVVSLHFAHMFAKTDPNTWSLRIDPARMAYGVMGGIGFLGAGVIMRQESGVRGLTTAASLWCTAALGLACGFGMYLVAAFAASLMVFTLVVLNRLDLWIPSRRGKTLVVTIPVGENDNVKLLQTALENRRIEIKDVDYMRDFKSNVETITLSISIPPRVDEALLRTINQDIPELNSMVIR